MNGKGGRKLRSAYRHFQEWCAGNPIRLFTFGDSLKGYTLETGKFDLRASLNVALLAIPQGMAYAAIAELPILYGIICSAIAAIIAPLFASSRQTILGPTNATSLMVFSFFAAQGLAMPEKLALMPLLVLMVGIICLIGSVLKAAELLQYISQSVLVGYITGAAMLIIMNQGKHLLGVAEVVKPASNFFGMLGGLIDTSPSFLWQPAALGAATLLVYFSLSRFLPALPNFALTLGLMATGSAIAANTIPGWAEAVPNFPSFGLSDLQPKFPSASENGIFQDISTLMGVALAIAFLASLENTVMSKSIASRTGQRAEINQDMMSVGMANIASAFTAAMPASGSLTRSALNYESGAKSAVSSMLSGLFCLIAIFAFVLMEPNPVSFIPKTALAALVVAVAASLVKWKNIRICLRSTPDDAGVLIITFVAALIAPLYVAIFFGVTISIFLFLRKVSKPHLVEYEISDEGELRELGQKKARPIPAISIVHVEGALFFGASELFRTQVQRIVVDPNLKVIILRLKNAHHLDATSVMAMRDLIRFVRSEDRHLIISGATRDVYKVLKSSGVLETLQKGCRRKEGETNLFFYAPSNPNISTRDALLRAQELLGTKKADIKIFYDPSHDKK
ncbi:SulP family inorganic anion transporter [Akkermansiaceae bacterium]|nr:SulP family inorganic anion transporter [Akkermansiaceae bacterium]MDB4532588.1 SulP family inorganic anion transporter [bacterium]MDB4562896.1 SulP family inorganic anion transporter [Akkermansiaceae bacterium]